MREKLPLLKEYFIILVEIIKSEKFMNEQLQWTGWNKKKKEVSLLQQLQLNVIGNDVL
jgi:hypothetical protein